MKKYSNYKSNYDKYPVVQVSETSENVCWHVRCTAECMHPN